MLFVDRLRRAQVRRRRPCGRGGNRRQTPGRCRIGARADWL
jgi:hypothetical protein